MNERMHGTVIGGLVFLGGMLVGAGTGLLLAPASGARTRHRLKAMVEDCGEEICDITTDVRAMVDHVMARGRRIVA